MPTLTREEKTVVEPTNMNRRFLLQHPTTGVRGVLTLLAILIPLLLMATAWPTDAHTDLRGSTPRPGQVLTQAPSRVALEFNDPINPELAVVTLTPGEGEDPVELATSVTRATVTATARSALADVLGTVPAEWTLAYRVVSADGHPLTGQIRFTVEPSSAPTSPTPTLTTNDPPATAPASTPADDATGNRTLATAIIGGMTLAATATIMYLLGRKRSESDQ